MNTLLTTVQDLPIPLVILYGVLFALSQGRAIIRLLATCITFLATCATLIALFGSGERADRAARILEVLLAALERLTRGGGQ